MIDIHTHILPIIDDGPRSYEEALSCLRELAETGISKVCLTPHVNKIAGEKGRDKKIQEIFDELLRLKNQENIPVDLVSGAEIFYTPDVPALLKDHPSWFFGKQRRYILLEFHGNMLGIEKVLSDFFSEGIIPVLAHIERYPWSEKKNPLFSYFRNNGMILQINAGSLLGRYGWLMKRKAKALIREGCCHVVASDTHESDDLDYSLEKVRPVLTKLAGMERAECLLVGNPEKIIAGEAIVTFQTDSR